MASGSLGEVLRVLRATALQQELEALSDGELLERYVRGREPAPFEVLVRRHGPMVLAVARRVLGNEADAEDAFQATFLVLVRKAAAIVPRGMVGNWLYGVAHTTALKARAMERNRRAREKTVAKTARGNAGHDLCLDLRETLDEELSRLPDKYRVPLVLCELEGRTIQETARHLAWPAGTVASRLSRARTMLARRLTRRGLALSAGGLTTVLAQEAAGAAVPSWLVLATVHAGNGIAMGWTPAAAASVKIAALMQGVHKAMFFKQLRMVAAAAFVIAFLGAGVGLLACCGEADDEPPPTFVATPLPDRDKPLADPIPKPRRLPTLDKGMTYVDEARFSRDGKFVVSAGTKDNRGKLDSLMLIWEVASGKLAASFKQPEGVGAGVDFSPDGKLLASASVTDNTISLYEVGTWKERATLKEHRHVIEVTFSPDSKTLASRSCAFAGQGVISEVKLWEVATGKERLQVPLAEREGVMSMDFSSDGALLALGTTNGEARLVETATGKERAPLAAFKPGEGVARATFSPDGKTLAVWTQGGTIRLYDVATGKEQAQLKGEPGLLNSVRFAPDGKTLAGGQGSTVRLWDIATKKRRFALPFCSKPRGEVQHLDFTSDGKLLAVSGWASKRPGDPFTIFTRVFDTATGEELTCVERARAFTFAPRGNTAAVITGDLESAQGRQPDDLTLWDVRTFTEGKSKKQ